MMKKVELIERVYDLMTQYHPGEIGKPYRAKIMLGHVIDMINEQQRLALLQEGEVSVAGLGKLVVVHRKERKARDPRTGNPVTVPAQKRVKFRGGTKVKDYINYTKLSDVNYV